MKRREFIGLPGGAVASWQGRRTGGLQSSRNTPILIALAFSRRQEMKRREFIGWLGTAAAAWPIAAPAQQPATGKWRIGMLVPGDRYKFILEGLRDLGYIEGQNLLVERRFDDKAEGLAAFATELATLRPDIIVAVGTQAALAAKRATSSIPIAMLASNPVGNRLVESLAHPGSNVTGL